MGKLHDLILLEIQVLPGLLSLLGFMTWVVVMLDGIIVLKKGVLRKEDVDVVMREGEVLVHWGNHGGGGHLAGLTTGIPCH